MKKLLAVLAVALSSSIAQGQFTGHKVIDGHIHLLGRFDQLAGIEALSPGGHLSLDFVDVPGVGRIDLKDPFPTTASVVANTPTQVLMGVLGAESRIDIEGNTATAIGYEGDNAIAAQDLTVNIGLGDLPPVSFAYSRACHRVDGCCRTCRAAWISATSLDLILNYLGGDRSNGNLL